MSLLLRELAPHAVQGDDTIDRNGVSTIDIPADVRAQLEEFLTGLWANDAHRGLWQTIHGIEGSLPLIIALDGPDAVLSLAQKVDKIGAGWA